MHNACPTITTAPREALRPARTRTALDPLPQRERSTGPETHSLVVNGRGAVSVSLSGKHAAGRGMILDDTDWQRVSFILGDRWNIARTGEMEYVVGYGGKAGVLVSKGRGLVLARWLTWGAPGEVVLYRDGDVTNLTRSNLITVSRREHMEMIIGLPGSQERSRAS